MADFEDLDPETRCFALVGRFLHAWAVMEDSLHRAIGAALAIEVPKLQILCANMEFGAKIYTMRTLIDASPDLQKEDKKEFQKTLSKLAEYAQIRNMIAHNQFQPDESKKGVEFLVIKARGKFELPKEVWLDERFRREGDTISQFRTLLDRIAMLFFARPLPPQNYAHALRPFLYMDTPGWHRPMQEGMAPVLRNHLLSRQAQDPPRSSPCPTNDKTTAQTPPKSEE
jgi:hypothetical protein